MVLRQLARDSIIYGGTDFLFKLIAFWTFPLIAAALSPRAFGTLELLLTATALLGTMANCGLNNALQRFYWDEQTNSTQRPALVSSGLAALALLLVIAMAVGAASFLVYRLGAESSQLALSWIGLLAGLVLMTSGQVVQYLLDVTRLHRAPWIFAGVSLFSRVLTVGAGLLAVVWLDWGLDGLLMAQATVMVATVPLALVAVRKDLTWKVDWVAARKLMQFGSPFIFVGLAFWLFGSMDRWLLAGMTSMDEVGIFSVGQRFASVILFVSMAFGQAWSPLAIKIRADHPQNYRALYVDILLMLLCAMTILGGGISLFATELVAWLMPVDYHGAGLVLAALALGLVLQSSMQVTAMGISLENKTYLFARLSWLAAALNLLLNLAMIPTLGALGAAVATSLCYLFLTSAYLYFTQRLHPLPLPWGKILVLAALWLVLAGCQIGQQMGHPMASSVVWRAMLLFVSLLVCGALIPWRKALHVER